MRRTGKITNLKGIQTNKLSWESLGLDSLVRASEAVEPPDESRCSRAGLLLETDSCPPSCSGAETEEENKKEKEKEKEKTRSDRSERMRGWKAQFNPINEKTRERR